MFVKKKYDHGLDMRKPFEQRWILNLAFLAGKQYTFFNDAAHMLQPLLRARGQVRNLDNQLLPRWRRQVSDLIKNNPEMSVVPVSNDIDDIKAAKMAGKVLKYFWKENKMRKKIRLLAGWIYSTGNGFLDDRWNTKKGPSIINPETGAVEYAGDADCGVWSPLEIVVPFYSFGDTDHHEFPWLIKAKRRAIEWIANNYKKGDQVASEPIASSEVLDATGLLGIGGSDALTVEGATVIDFYLQPNKDYPRGLFVTACNGIILQKEDYPLNHYHLEHFKDIDIPGLFWGKATLEDGVGLQKTWNRTISSIDEYNRKVAKGKGLTPRGSKLSNIPDDRHGEWIEYTPVMGHKPEIMTMKDLPSTYPLLLNITKTSMEDLFSQHEVSRGTNKSDIRSGEMVSILLEQDAHGSIISHAVFEEALERVMTRVLKRIQKGYTDDRTITVVGKEGEYDIFDFKGANLGNNTDVSVKKQSSLPDSKTTREATVLNKFQQGLYGDPADPEVRREVMNLLDDSIVENIYDGVRLDEKMGRFENDLIMKGYEDLIINSYDNDGVHLKEHNNYRKTLEYQQRKVRGGDEFILIDQRFELHVSEHMKRLIERQKEMMKQREGMKK